MSNTDNNVQKIGKFRYIEPNDVLEHEMYPERAEGARSYNITHPYEDYSIDVELEVKIPRRGIWPNSFHDTTKSNANSKVGTESFFGGTNGFLTDTPGSMIYKDILNNQADRESLGITHIHITYNSYFVPEITINFTDIRGMGLFMSHEEDYRLHRQTQGTVGVEKFFAALFTFPYPEFTLKVKGFYGKKVSYSLVVSDFKSSFNNQTGNFDATVKFIGKMYGVYTDIPMTYLLIAPYCKYGTGDKTVWEECEFYWKDENGNILIDENGNKRQVPTLISLKQQILAANQDIRGGIESVVAPHQTLFQKKQLLDSILMIYTNMTDYVSGLNSRIITDGQKIFLFKGDDSDTMFGYLYNYNTMLNHTQNLYDKLKLYNDTYSSDTISFIIPFDRRSAKVGDGDNFITININNHQIDGDIIFQNTNSSFIIDNYPGIKRQILNLPNGEHKFYLVNAVNFVTSLNNQRESTTQAINNIWGQVSDGIDTKFEDAIGFVPSIKNIFTIILAHLQAFLTVFNKCINDINSNDDRKITTGGLSLQMLPDIPSWVTSDAHLPPFPAIKDISNNTFTYPTTVPNLNLEESELINHFFVGTSEAIKQNAITTTHNDENNAINNYFIPTCIADFNCYNNVHKNPYYYTFKNNNDAQSVDWIFTFFGYRCAQKFLLEQSYDNGIGLKEQAYRDNDTILTAEEFGIYEAYNFFLAHPQLKQDVYDKLFNGSDVTDANFHEFILNNFSFDGTPPPPTTWTNNKFIAEISSDKYKVFNLDNGIGYPARIAHNSDYNTQYESDKNNPAFSFIKGIGSFPNRSISQTIPRNRLNVVYKLLNVSFSTRPYGLMQFIPSDILLEWDSALEQAPMNNITCVKHKTLVGQYIDNKPHNTYYYNPLNGGYYGNHETCAWNPSYSLLFKTGYITPFFVKLSATNNFYKQFVLNETTLHPANYIMSNDSNNCIVYSINGFEYNNKYSEKTCTMFDGGDLNSDHCGRTTVPIFFHENLTPASFLSVLPHNLLGCGRLLRDGRRIAKIPYVTKLFLGYIIHELQNLKNKPIGDYELFFRTLLLRSLANKSAYDLYGTMDSHRTTDNEFSAWVGQDYEYNAMIYLLLCHLTTDDNGVFVDTGTRWVNKNVLRPNISDYSVENNRQEKLKYIPNFSIHASGDEYVHELTSERAHIAIKILNDEGYFSNDILGLSNEYEEWASSSSSAFKTINNNGEIIYIPGFKWLKNNMTLREMKSDNVYSFHHDGNIITLSGKTPYIRLKSLLSSDYIAGKLQDINNTVTTNNEESLIQASLSNDNPLNHYYYTSQNAEEEGVFGNIYSSIIFTNNDYVHLEFNPQWKGTQLLNNLVKHVEFLICPYNRTPYYGNTYLSASRNLFKTAFNSFKNTLQQLCTLDNTVPTVNENNVNVKISIDEKLSMYRTLKNLYDKHFTDLNREMDMYDIKSSDDNSEINKFHFIDTYYNDLSDNFLINTDTLVDLIDTVIDTYGNGASAISTDISLYSFLSLICQKHNMLLISMPIFNGSVRSDTGNDNFKQMFKPIPTNNAEALYGPSYICFYPHQASQHLDIPISQYRNDSFLIKDVNETQEFEGPTTITGLNSDENVKYTIPAFGVEYGTQKQSIFTNINVNMDNPQVTEASVAVQFGIANHNNTETSRLTMDGQDLFKIYSNYSYTCQVEMMGCAQIQPLMYFQLNNIPMFRGAYQIINVEHDITPGNMITSFKGVRINKTNIPMTQRLINLSLDDLIDQYIPPVSGETTIETFYTNMPSMNKYNGNLTSRMFREANEIKFWDLPSDNNLLQWKSDDAMAKFTTLNPSLKMLVSCILSDLEHINNQNILGYKLGMYITSTVRTTNSGSTSDHECNSNGNNIANNSIRSSRVGRSLDEGGNSIFNSSSYLEMGCAIDFLGMRNGAVDKENASIELYNHIIRHYYPYIHQLIWETKQGETSSNSISHVIHMSSYGENKRADLNQDLKCDMFVYEYDSNGRNPRTIRNVNELSPAYKSVSDNVRTQAGINNISLPS